MRDTALPTDGRFRFVASDRTGRPWITLIVLRGVHQTGTGSMAEIDTAIKVATAAGAGALLPAGGLVFRHARHIAEMATSSRLPAVYTNPNQVGDAGLLSYGADLDVIWRRAAVFVDKIFKGAKPADLPVEQPTKFKLVINLKTAKAIGLSVPKALLLRADEVIQ